MVSQRKVINPLDTSSIGEDSQLDAYAGVAFISPNPWYECLQF